MADNYTLGKGKLYFDRTLANGTQEGERFFGNVSEFNLTIEEEKLDHYASTGGVRQKDKSVSLEVTRTGSIVTDEISSENLALFFFGESASLSQTAATVTGEAHNDVKQGRYYQLGATANNPSGVRALAVHTAGPPAINIIVKDDATPTPATFVEGDDYTIDMALGRIYIVPGGDIVDGTNLLIDYKTATASRERIVSGSTAVKGKLRFISDNPEGPQRDYFMPSVTVAPNGDFGLISEEWMSIPLNVEVLKPTTGEAIYVDGRALTA